MEKHNLCEERTLDNYLFKTTFASFMIFNIYIFICAAPYIFIVACGLLVAAYGI